MASAERPCRHLGGDVHRLREAKKPDTEAWRRVSALPANNSTLPLTLSFIFSPELPLKLHSVGTCTGD